MFEHAQQYFNNLTAEAGTTAVNKWKDVIEAAKHERHLNVKAMDIYASKLNTDKQKIESRAPTPQARH